MRLTCPACSTVFPVEAALMDAQAREAVAGALRLPAPLGDRLLRYLGLFRPKSRSLTWDRAARLLQELAAAITEGKIERNGRTWSAPLEYWQMALDQMLGNRDKLQLPLKSHGYLFEIVAGYAGKAEGAVEQARIDRAAYPAQRSVEQQSSAPSREVVGRALDQIKQTIKGGPR